MTHGGEIGENLGTRSVQLHVGCPVCAHDQDGHMVELASELSEQAEGGNGGCVEVVENDHEREDPGCVLEHGDNGVELAEPAAVQLRGAWRGDVALLETGFRYQSDDFSPA